jgi:hypothetical protein
MPRQWIAKAADATKTPSTTHTGVSPAEGLGGLSPLRT